MSAAQQSPASRATREPRPQQRHAFLAVVRRALRDQRRSPLTWGVPLGLMSALELAIYPSVEKSLSKAIETYPDALKQAFRIERIDSPAQFLNGEMFSLIVPLAIAFFVIRAASKPVAGHEERGWIDVVLASPVRRATLSFGAFVASAISCAGILLVLGVMIWIAGQIFGAVVSLGALAPGLLVTWTFGVLFGGLAALLAGSIGNWTVVTGIAVGVVVSMYVLDVVSRVTDSLHWLGKLSAFHYYGAPLVDGFQGANCAGLLGVGLVLAALGTWLFERRDIHG